MEKLGELYLAILQDEPNTRNGGSDVSKKVGFLTGLSSKKKRELAPYLMQKQEVLLC